MRLHYRKSIFRLKDFSPSNRFAAPVVIAAILFCCCFRTCSAPAQQSQSIISTAQQGAIRSALVGEWVCNIGHRKIVLKLTPEGDFNLGDQKGPHAEGGRFLLLLRVVEVMQETGMRVSQRAPPACGSRTPPRSPPVLWRSCGSRAATASSTPAPSRPTGCRGRACHSASNRRGR